MSAIRGQATVNALIVLFFFYLIALGVVADASTYSQSKCFTQQATSKPASIQTITDAQTFMRTRTVKVTTTPTITRTPASATATSAVTSTTLKTTVLTQRTDKYTTTTTITQTSTQISTATSTSFVTPVVVVTVSGTTTIEPSQSFTHLGSALAAGGTNTPAAKAKRLQREHARDTLGDTDLIILQPRAAPTYGIRARPDGPKHYGPPLFPATVTCRIIVEVVSTSTAVSTAKTTATITGAQGTITSTSTSVTTSTVTSGTIVASTTIKASTTTTQIITSTTTSTITSTLTSTSTSFQAEATFYAACAADNIVTTVNGAAIDLVVITGSAQVLSTASSPYDCCVQCNGLNAGKCGGSIYDHGQCITLTADSCYPATVVGSFYTYGSDGASVSNGLCGQFGYAGTDLDPESQLSSAAFRS